MPSGCPLEIQTMVHPRTPLFTTHTHTHHVEESKPSVAGTALKPVGNQLETRLILAEKKRDKIIEERGVGKER